MLKMTESPDELAPSKNNGSRSTSTRNNDSRPAFRKNDDDSEVDGFGVGRNGVKHTKKSGKLSKSRKSKNKKISKSQNSAKSRKKLSKSGNSINSNAIEDGPKFLTSDAKTTFNCL